MSRLVVDQGFAGSRHGALTVIETPSSRDEITRRLKELHPDLFLERQLVENVVGHAYPVWCVCIDTGREGIVALFEWRDPDGDPIPYPSGRIIDEFQRRYQRGPVSHEQILNRNADLLAESKRESAAERAQMVDDHYPLARGFGHILPRSQGLRRARDKRRSRGEKC